MGRKRRIAGTDLREKEYWYDAVGNLREETDSELRRQGRRRIQYHYGRLGETTEETRSIKLLPLGGGQVQQETGNRHGTIFPYVKDIGYDTYGQRVYSIRERSKDAVRIRRVPAMAAAGSHRKPGAGEHVPGHRVYP
ncbi:MAG: hypothetical protein LBP60_06290 [Spirochaetaceae bacterium]|nr:hypothetical protein [Spirochaetaceae bacterium]